ncbi:hypothetical protein SLITO_v1c01250 [Spiroplasma litorale]|uniref:Uncharacterized protein n=1 Tax=Spiroplasma litorale TaxID=216942 RepID=A0A0K1W0V8_9MOLU|nr:hypothetical protein SLITO_v1c01250 [Spiroplasma litorale]
MNKIHQFLYILFYNWSKFSFFYFIGLIIIFIGEMGLTLSFKNGEIKSIDNYYIGVLAINTFSYILMYLLFFHILFVFSIKNNKFQLFLLTSLTKKNLFIFNLLSIFIFNVSIFIINTLYLILLQFFLKFPIISYLNLNFIILLSAILFSTSTSMFAILFILLGYNKFNNQIISFIFLLIIWTFGTMFLTIFFDWFRYFNPFIAIKVTFIKDKKYSFLIPIFLSFLTIFFTTFISIKLVQKIYY